MPFGIFEYDYISEALFCPGHGMSDFGFVKRKKAPQKTEKSLCLRGYLLETDDITGIWASDILCPVALSF